MRPGTRRRISLNAEAWTLCRASILSVPRETWRSLTVRLFPDRSLDSGRFNPAGAGTEYRLGTCSLNMVVKLQPEIHNHACLAPLGAGQTWLCHSNFVNRGASGLQPRRAFFIDRGAAAATTVPGHRKPGVCRTGPAPARAIARRLAAALNCLRALPRCGRTRIVHPRRSRRCA